MRTYRTCGTHGAFGRLIVSAVQCAALCVALAVSGRAVAQSVTMPQVSMPSVSFDSMFGDTFSGGQGASSQGSAAGGTTGSASGSTGAKVTGASGVSASDLAALSSMGALDSLGSLVSGSSSSYLGGVYGSSNNTATNLLLQQILEQLSQLNEQAQNATLASQPEPAVASGGAQAQGAAVASSAEFGEASGTALADSAKTQGAIMPRLLRFSVNGYNILSTCRTVYISVPEEDGTFLVTGDRLYLSDGKYRSETFHILFRPSGTRGGVQSYSTATAVSQDYANEYSFLYQMAQKNGLSATRTGNLVSLRTTDQNWRLELLIDVGAR